jgi:hypothetical protein
MLTRRLVSELFDVMGVYVPSMTIITITTIGQ